MLIALLVGLLGSLGHCVGMCSLMTLLLTKRSGGAGLWIGWAHLGRISSYGLLGAIAGGIGGQFGGATPHVHHADPGPWRFAQSSFALLMAGGASYMTLSLLGRVRSPEMVLAGVTRRWRTTVQACLPNARQGVPRALGLYGMGVLWGLLPCGLVLTALLPAAATGNLWRGGAVMVAFGLGTIPALLGVGWVATREPPIPRRWPRYGLAGLSGLFALQMALRGIAAWGWINHLEFGGVMLW